MVDDANDKILHQSAVEEVINDEIDKAGVSGGSGGVLEIARVVQTASGSDIPSEQGVWHPIPNLAQLDFDVSDTVVEVSLVVPYATSVGHDPDDAEMPLEAYLAVYDTVAEAYVPDVCVVYAPFTKAVSGLAVARFETPGSYSVIGSILHVGVDDGVLVGTNSGVNALCSLTARSNGTQI